MHQITQIYVDGQFVTPQGEALFDLHDPTTATVIGKVRLGDERDVAAAVAAAKRAFPAWSRTSKETRIALLQRMHEAVLAHRAELIEAIVAEYGAPQSRASFMADHAAFSFLDAARALKAFPLEQAIGNAQVIQTPIGVVALITPWNNNAGLISNKLAYALAAGCTAVIKPSEMSALQTSVLLKAMHAAGAPAGVWNVVNGRGDVVGSALTHHPDVAKISFTGSTVVGKSILREASATLKRVTLELGGKSPTLILEDADFAEAIPKALMFGLANNGQACINGTRILVPRSRRDEALSLIKAGVEALRSGDPRDPTTAIGPLVSQAQYDRVQRYIRLGIEEGAALLTGGEGHPEGQAGYTVRPTVFADVTNDMTIARDEIFGPVLAVLTYEDEEDAIRIANDTPYGLHAYVFSASTERAAAVANRLEAGRVSINGAFHHPDVPFGGFKQSGIGREYGVFGLQAYLEPKALMGAA
ncbi:aldehyde dehydrogenase family protein [bacterium]|nr:aldehyde dehydrogenase family protein [bacterium]